MEDQEIVKPLFHYTYKQEAAILDSVYNYQGNLLAVCNSNGDVLFYQADSEDENREVLFSIDKKLSGQKSAAILKLAWSLPNFGLFATASVSQ